MLVHRLQIRPPTQSAPQKNFAFVDKPGDPHGATTENATSQTLAKYILIALESEKERRKDCGVHLISKGNFGACRIHYATHRSQTGFWTHNRTLVFKKLF